MRSLEKKRKFVKTYVSGKDYKVFKLTGDEYEKSARHNASIGDYRAASIDHKNASECYREAFEKSDDSMKEDLHAMYVGANLASKKAHRMAALYRATEKKPFLIRGLIRKIKGEHILGIFIFSMLFSVPSITGGVTGNVKDSSFMGILFFFIGLVCSYFLVLKNFLIYRHTDQY